MQKHYPTHASVCLLRLTGEMRRGGLLYIILSLLLPTYLGHARCYYCDGMCITCTFFLFQRHRSHSFSTADEYDEYEHEESRERKVRSQQTTHDDMMTVQILTGAH